MKIKLKKKERKTIMTIASLLIGIGTLLTGIAAVITALG
jgi:hypothetical protein